MFDWLLQPDIQDNDIGKVILQLKDKNKEYQDKTKQYDELYEQYNKLAQVSEITLLSLSTIMQIYCREIAKVYPGSVSQKLRSNLIWT